MRPAFLRFLCVLSAFWVLWGFCASAKTLYVADTGDGSGGLTWETAFQSVNEAVILASTGDAIHMKSGVYYGNVQITTPITLLGGLKGIDVNSVLVVGKTTILPNAPGRVVDIQSDCSLSNIKAMGAYGFDGQGFLILEATSTLRECESENNMGTGINCVFSNVNLLSCTITNNISESEGGVSIGFSKAILSNCVISNNIATGSSDIIPQPGLGGGVAVHGGSPVRIINCLFYGNAAGQGLDIYVYEPMFKSLFCRNCTFASVKSGVGNFRNLWSQSGDTVPTELVNCVIWGNPTPLEGDNWTVSHSVVRGGYPGDGNINEDPLFVDPSNSDFHLQVGSPCIDAASTTGPATDLDGNARPVDVLGTGRDDPRAFDMGAYEFQLPEGDLNSNGRADPLDLFLFGRDWMKATGP